MIDPTKVTKFEKPRLRKITILNIFGQEEQMEGRIMGEYENGYNIKDGGGWSCYGKEGDKPAQFWIVKWKGKRKAVGVPKNRVVSF